MGSCFYSSLSDFSDYDYDSSDAEYRTRSRVASRRQSLAAGGPSGGRGGYVEQPSYAALDDDREGDAGLLDPNDPFADPTDFLGSIGGGSSGTKAKERMECKLEAYTDIELNCADPLFYLFRGRYLDGLIHARNIDLHKPDQFALAPGNRTTNLIETV